MNDPLKNDIEKRLNKARKDIPAKEKPSRKRQILIFVMAIILVVVMLVSLFRFL